MGNPSNTTLANAPKSAFKSVTILINGGIFIALSFIQIIDILTGANILNPLIGVFIKDPEQSARVITAIGQVYSLANLWMRYRTTQPITLKL